MAYVPVDISDKFIKDLGETILPAGVPELDFSTIDKTIAADDREAMQLAKTMASRIEEVGKYQDKLTGVEGYTGVHAQMIEQAKEDAGIDDKLFADAIDNIKDPLATYTLNRKMASFLRSPTIKQIAIDKAVIDNFKKNIWQVSDPKLQVMALSHLKDVIDNDDPSKMNLMPNSLNAKNFLPIDLGTSYLDRLKKYAPGSKMEENVVLEDGTKAVKSTLEFDENRIKAARNSFVDDPQARNNLIAQGIINAENGEIEDETFFQTIEDAHQSGKNESYKYVQRPSRPRTGGTNKKGKNKPSDNANNIDPKADVQAALKREPSIVNIDTNNVTAGYYDEALRYAGTGSFAYSGLSGVAGGKPFLTQYGLRENLLDGFLTWLQYNAESSVLGGLGFSDSQMSLSKEITKKINDGNPNLRDPLDKLIEKFNETGDKSIDDYAQEYLTGKLSDPNSALVKQTTQVPGTNSYANLGDPEKSFMAGLYIMMGGKGLKAANVQEWGCSSENYIDCVYRHVKAGSLVPNPEKLESLYAMTVHVGNVANNY